MNRSVSIDLPFFVNEESWHCDLSVDDLRRLSAPVIDKAVEPIREAMHKAGIRKGGFGLVLLAGGSSLLPGVRERVTEITGAEPVAFPRDPMYAIAYGAALYHRLVYELPKEPNRLMGETLSILSDSSSETMLSPLVGEIEQIPTSKERPYRVDGPVSIVLYSGNHPEPGMNTRLREKYLRLSSNARNIVVRIDVDANKMVHLNAFDPKKPEESISIELNPDRVSEEEIVELRKRFGVELADEIESSRGDHDSHPCIGIDIGTTTSELAYTTRTGKVRLQALENPEQPKAYDPRCFPSVVYYPGRIDRPEVANPVAWEASERGDPLAFQSFKIEDWTRSLANVDGETITVFDLTTALIDKIWSTARESPLKKAGKLSSAVVTVPAAFTPDQCALLWKAAYTAGIQQVKLIDEPVAAFIYYWQQFLDGASFNIGNTLVFDYGGGTADVAILEIEKNPAVVPGKDKYSRQEPYRSPLATKSAFDCGGKVVDEQIMEFLKSLFEKQNKGISLESMPGKMSQLRLVAEDKKVELTNLYLE